MQPSKSTKSAALKGVIGNLRKMEGNDMAERKAKYTPCAECGGKGEDCKCEGSDEKVDMPSNISGSY